jgi:hypothetical protein
MVVNQLNEYWDVRTQGAAITAPVTTGEKIAVAIGAAFWALIVLGLALIIVLAS